MSERRVQSVRPIEVLAFACELAMLVLLVVAAWGIASGTAAQLGLAVVFVAVVVAVWAVWLAPTSKRRLPVGPRLAVQSALFVATAGLLGAAGYPWWGAVFAVVAVGTFAVTKGS